MSGPGTKRNRLVVFSGGSAANSIVDVFNGLLSSGEAGKGQSGNGLKLQKLSYVIGISDNGGSTSEILRVFGGPGIGDVRSRLIRLAPEPTGTSEEDSVKTAIKHLLNYRLPADEDLAKEEWLSVVEGTHLKWKKIPSDKRELLRSFLVHLHSEILKRARPPLSTFNFHSASIGNLFLTSTRLFFGSFESAIYLFQSITGVPENVQVVPAINSMFSHHIAAGLTDGTVIVGQNQISHPTLSWPSPALGQSIGTESGESDDTEGEGDGVEDANLPGSHPSLKSRNIVFEKDNEPELGSRVERVWYINPYGQEIRPPANPKVVGALGEAGAVVFSIGSLYTSIIPCLILRGIGHVLSSPHIPFKILILNGSLDRETGPVTGNPQVDFSASDFIRAIVRACVDSQSNIFIPPGEYVKYVTHVVYLEGRCVPKVDVEELGRWGIRAVKVEGQSLVKKKGVYYEVERLKEALGGIIEGRL
ncbi:UPF0052-domain-containing protein [Terfezia boudieri ATCC MYA-4762]|uniref:UPF0052-domain-containing protein n=1 Tax=Terfezia boudieri ATCC MYA-4762 TaxID=1051890 RepID=A0A3N4M4H5_9PEZI|nr:UPF0052-domain-containing protein [Terfezia boudieri ATCC MYA-4762]